MEYVPKYKHLSNKAVRTQSYQQRSHLPRLPQLWRQTGHRKAWWVQDGQCRAQFLCVTAKLFLAPQIIPLKNMPFRSKNYFTQLKDSCCENRCIFFLLHRLVIYLHYIWLWLHSSCHWYMHSQCLPPSCSPEDPLHWLGADSSTREATACNAQM